MKKTVYLILATILIGIINFETNASFSNKFGKNIKIIGCINTITLETRKPNKNGNCFYGKGWQNIALPPESHLKYWKSLFNNRQIINRLPIVNFESSFNPKAKNHIAIGYVQTLKKYNIDTNIYKQLEWMKNRQISQKNGNCSHWKKYGEERLLRCLYARHYGATYGYHWYPNKLMVARQFYLNYFK